MKRGVDRGLYCSDFGISGMTTFPSSEGETTMKSATAVKDHVCGMDVETATAAGQTEYKGQTYYFCGSNCKQKFDLNPEQYLCKSAETPKSGHGCCCG
jgi:Cu+-exporting ATPase